MPKKPRATLCLDDYDCVGFDLDHTLCRYNVGPMIRLEYDLLAEFLVAKKGYDPAIRAKPFDADRHFVCKGLTLDCDKGNLLRLSHDGFILGASHGTKRLTDAEIERAYGRCRKKHPGSDYTAHLSKHGPANMVAFHPLLHSFMDYFDIAAPLLCARIVDVLDQINNGGRPMEEYSFYPDVQEGLRDMFMRTNFASDRGGFFPEMKAHPEKYILKRSAEFRAWLKMLRDNGKYLYVITGSHFDFASHVASYALGDDWKDLFDIVIFFARKPSFFWENRPFWRLEGPKEVESLEGWEDLETGDYYSQGNWKDLNEFFENVTEWEPSCSLYFGDNVLQDVLAPRKFTATIDVVAVSEELSAEGMAVSENNLSASNRRFLSHPHSEDIVSEAWGSYFYATDSRVVKKKSKVMGRASSFKQHYESGYSSDSLATSAGGTQRAPSVQSREDEMKKALSLRRVASLKTPIPSNPDSDVTATPAGHPPLPPLSLATGTRSRPSSRARPTAPSLPASRSFDAPSISRSNTPLSAAAPQANSGTPPAEDSKPTQESLFLPTGPSRVNTLWGAFIRDYAKMCIPDLEALVDYPVDYKFPAFGRNKKGELVSSGFFPADPASLHAEVALIEDG